MGDAFDEQVEGVAVLSDPVRRSLYRYVVGEVDAVSREQAAEAMGVQRALAAFHLDKLAAQGLLQVEFRRLSGRTGPGAGRPAKLYRRSAREIDVSLPPREYDLAAGLLAEAIESAGEGGDVRKALTRAARALGRAIGEAAEARAGARASARRRREALIAVLAEHGFEPRDADGELVLANCPFHTLARQYTDLVCGMNLELLRGVRAALSLDDATLRPRLDPVPGYCCVRFGAA